MSRFDDFWKTYPIKKGKVYAKKCWDKLKLDDQADMIIDHINLMLSQDKLWKRRFGIPHPSTYINQERWTDEPEIEQPQERKIFLPRDDNLLIDFAKQNGLPSPGSGQSYYEYRRVLERALANRELN